MSDKQFWQETALIARSSPDTFYKERLQVAYRLVRELARIKGLLNDEEFLYESETVQNAWKSPITYMHPHPIGPDHIRKAKVPLLPPEVPSLSDPLLHLWIAVMEEMALRLGIYGSFQTKKGIYRLLDPQVTHVLFPDQEEIMAHEKFFIQGHLQLQIKQGTIDALKKLKKVDKLSGPEAERTSTLSLSTASSTVKSEVQRDRALMVLRIEELLSRIKSEGGVPDYRTEIQALKLLSSVQGLHKGREDDILKDMITAIATTGRKTAEMEHKLEHNPPKQIEAEVTQVDEEI